MPTSIRWVSIQIFVDGCYIVKEKKTVKRSSYSQPVSGTITNVAVYVGKIDVRRMIRKAIIKWNKAVIAAKRQYSNTF